MVLLLSLFWAGSCSEAAADWCIRRRRIDADAAAIFELNNNNGDWIIIMEKDAVYWNNVSRRSRVVFVLCQDKAPLWHHVVRSTCNRSGSYVWEVARTYSYLFPRWSFSCVSLGQLGFSRLATYSYVKIISHSHVCHVTHSIPMASSERAVSKPATAFLTP